MISSQATFKPVSDAIAHARERKNFAMLTEGAKRLNDRISGFYNCNGQKPRRGVAKAVLYGFAIRRPMGSRVISWEAKEDNQVNSGDGIIRNHKCSSVAIYYDLFKSLSNWDFF